MVRAMVALLLAVGGSWAWAADAPRAVLVDDFEAGAPAWKFVGGEEFPGAKGALDRDIALGHNSTTSMRLSADFTGGGAYVGAWKDLPDLGGGFLTAIRFWVKSDGVSQIGIRLGDKSGQCHQAARVKVELDNQWHELVLPLAELVGGEHWGGANDGKFHGPLTGLGINIGKDGLESGTAGALWFDDLSCDISDTAPGQPTILSGVLSQPSCRPGYGLDLTYRWLAEPMQRDFTVFVHFAGPNGQTLFQGDHDPSPGTAVWTGKTEYTHTIVVPTDAPAGEYRILVGLYDHAASARGWDHQKLGVGEGVKTEEDGTTYEIGRFTVDPAAPVPKLPEPTLDLDGYHLTFSEEFDGPLDVSAWGPGTRWIAHTPYAGDFGDARFADPEPGFPFTIEDGVLRIEARKDDSGWRAGLLCSVDPKGQGFSQQYGYFEMRAKLPKGPGTWPAFWLLGVPELVNRGKVTQIEIDVVEQYGVGPNALHTTVHLWYPGAKHWAEGKPSIVEGMTDDFHTYGVSIDEADIVFYYDGRELRRTKTPEEAKVPLYLLVDLALGGGWPIDKTPNPSFMYVDYVRAYAK